MAQHQVRLPTGNRPAAPTRRLPANVAVVHVPGAPDNGGQGPGLALGARLSLSGISPKFTPPPEDDLPPPPSVMSAHRDDVYTEIDVTTLRLGASVGQGGTAEVFHGTLNGKVVAVKLLFKHRRMSTKEEISFNREVAVLAKITHPNLVKFFGVAFKERPFRIITEFCEGGTAFDLIHNGTFRLTWKQRLQICLDTAVGMDYLHAFQPQIIHRDLKSLNLLLERAVESPSSVPVIKVSDFGLSRMKDGAEKWGKMTSQVGTLHWMAPEVFAGHDYDESADVYSYAMCMFETICLEVPFEDTDPAIIGSLTVKGIRPDLQRVPEDCPESLATLMMHCWAHDSARRPLFGKVVSDLRALGAPRGGASSSQARNNAAATERRTFTSVSL